MMMVATEWSSWAFSLGAAEGADVAVAAPASWGGDGRRRWIQYPLEGVGVRGVRRSVGDHVAALPPDGRGNERRRGGQRDLQIVLERRDELLGVVERLLHGEQTLVQLVARLVPLALLPPFAHQLSLDLA